MVASRLVIDVDLEGLSGHACIPLIIPALRSYTLNSLTVVLGRQAVQPLLERQQMLSGVWMRTSGLLMSLDLSASACAENTNAAAETREAAVRSTADSR